MVTRFTRLYPYSAVAESRSLLGCYTLSTGTHFKDLSKDYSAFILTLKLKLSKCRELLATHCHMPEDLSVSLLYLYCNFYDLAKARPLNLYFHCVPEVSHTNTDTRTSSLIGFNRNLKK